MNIDELVEKFRGNTDLIDQTLQLGLPDVQLHIKSNNEEIFERLGYYFRHIVKSDNLNENINIIEVEVYETGSDFAELNWNDWAREPGKEGKKDSYIDLNNVRLIRKVKTGMVFLQSETLRIATGSCLDNLNQVVNFIINQYMNYLQQQGWLICHAAALANSLNGIAIAGFSGGGKSTMMLHLLNQDSLDFVSNDRLFIKVINGQVLARGVPKLPRINPGTIVNNERLVTILDESEKDEYSSLDKDSLWQLERKYDVDVANLYGQQRFKQQTKLASFIVLNWSRSSEDETKIEEVDIEHSTYLLDAIMKSPGPFYHDAYGNFINDMHRLYKEPYIDALSKIRIIEVTGKVNFSKLESYCLTNFFSKAQELENM